MSNLFFSPENYVRKAIAKAGGPTFVSNQLSLSNGAVHAWCKKGRIPDINYARRVAEMSGIKIDLLRQTL